MDSLSERVWILGTEMCVSVGEIETVRIVVIGGKGISRDGNYDRMVMKI